MKSAKAMHRFESNVSKQYLKTIGEKLLHARSTRQISSSKAAAVLGISSARLNAIERGETDYSLKLLVTMCDYYRLDVLKICDL